MFSSLNEETVMTKMKKDKMMCMRVDCITGEERKASQVNIIMCNYFHQLHFNYVPVQLQSTAVSLLRELFE